MRKKMFMNVLMGAVLLLAASIPARAERGGGHEKGRHGGGEHAEGRGGGNPFSAEKLRERLGLNEDQTARMKTLLADYQKEQIRKDAEMQIAELEFTELLEQKNPDIAQIEPKLRAISNIQSDLSLFRVKKLLEAKKFLRTEQFQKFQNFILRSVVQKKGGMKGHGGQGRGQGRHEDRPDRRERPDRGEPEGDD